MNQLSQSFQCHLLRNALLKERNEQAASEFQWMDVDHKIMAFFGRFEFQFQQHFAYRNFIKIESVWIEVPIDCSDENRTALRTRRIHLHEPRLKHSKKAEFEKLKMKNHLCYKSIFPLQSYILKLCKLITTKRCCLFPQTLKMKVKFGIFAGHCREYKIGWSVLEFHFYIIKFSN